MVAHLHHFLGTTYVLGALAVLVRLSQPAGLVGRQQIGHKGLFTENSVTKSSRSLGEELVVYLSVVFPIQVEETVLK